jgi:nucleoside-diphosphate-sugar epimerase
MSTALVVGGSAATGRAIIEELKYRGYTITVFNRGTRNDGLSRDLEFVRGDPHFADSVRDTLAERSWDLAVVTYGRTRVLADELRGRVGRLITVSGMPVVKGHPGLPLDRRARWVLRDGGLALTGRCASANAAALIGAVVGHPSAAAGAIYHAADERQFSDREWIEAIAALMGHEFEYVDIPRRSLR